MSFEIELKAHVSDPEAVKKRLSALGIYDRAYEKDDVYWIPPSGNSGLPPSGLRVRRETGTNKTGRASETCLVTYKIRKNQGEIEVNDEREFTVSDGELFEDLLERLGLRRKIGKNKRGWAWIYRPPEGHTHQGREPADKGSPIRMELSEVRELGVCRTSRVKPQKIAGQAIFYPSNPEGSPDNRDLCAAGSAKIHKYKRPLGWFLELEILAPDDGKAVVARRRGELLSLLEKLGVPPGKIEKRPYTEMLAGAENSGKNEGP
ncbi:MAG: hypothetical protein LBS57_00055 [Treponema sp.]|jgi:adenylate cyclase class 2|nr:hypothetical protein [Treponema sp.]